MKSWILMTGLCAAMVLSARGAVVIEGVVKLPPPKTAVVATGRYQQRSGAIAAPEPPSAVVYLEGSFMNAAPPSSAVLEVSQKNFQFAPGLLPVLKGASVKFPNLDDDYHHVFSYSKAKEFDLGRYRKDEKPAAVVFDKPGPVRVGCEIHDHMRAIVLVLETPHFVKTAPDGKYRLEMKGVPDGQYVLKAWINEKTVWEQPVELKEGTTLQVNFPRS